MIGLWCNGSTTGFGSVCPGSNPGSPTKKESEFLTRSLFFMLAYAASVCCEVLARAATLVTL